MTFGFIVFEDFFYFGCKTGIDLAEPFCDIFVHRGF